MQTSPGQPLSARRHLGRRGRELRDLLGARHRGSSCACSTRPTSRREAVRIAAAGAAPTWSGTATCPTCGPGSSTAIASTAPTSRQGHRFNPNKVAARSLRQGDRPARSRWGDALFGYRVGDPDADLSFDDRDSAAVRAAERGHRPGLHLGRRPPAADALAQDGDLRAARQGLHAAAPGRARERCAAPTRAWRQRRGDRAPAATSASRRSSCCRSITTSTTGTWSRRA